MGLAKRRRLLNKGFRAIRDEGDGVFEVSFFGPPEFFLLLCQAAAGNRKALVLAEALKTMFSQIEAAGSDTMCLLCDSHLSDENIAILALLHAHRDDPSKVLGFGLCEHCAVGSQPDMVDRVLKKLKTNVITDLRRLEPFSEPGHA